MNAIKQYPIPIHGVAKGILPGFPMAYPPTLILEEHPVMVGSRPVKGGCPQGRALMRPVAQSYLESAKLEQGN